MSITVWAIIENIPYGWMRPATSIAAAIVRMAAFASSLPTEVLFEPKEEPTAPLFLWEIFASPQKLLQIPMHPLKFYVGKSANPTQKLEEVARSK